MTSSGIDTFLETTYKVGDTIFYNLKMQLRNLIESNKVQAEVQV